jgi:(p)ppGpp synthase/HD superfamily hydrolase
MVNKFVLKFTHLINYNINANLGSLFHDILEDHHSWTYNDVKQKWGVEVADIVFACTELRGRNRAERHGPEYYALLKTSELGSFVKICDVIANMTMGTMTGSSMLKKYRKDYPKFKELLYSENFKEMFDYIESNLLIDKK